MIDFLAPPRAGLFFAFCVSKSHHEKTWWLISILPLILHALPRAFFILQLLFPVVINVLYVIIIFKVFKEEIHFLYIFLVGESYI